MSPTIMRAIQGETESAAPLCCAAMGQVRYRMEGEVSDDVCPELEKYFFFGVNLSRLGSLIIPVGQVVLLPRVQAQ